MVRAVALTIALVAALGAGAHAEPADMIIKDSAADFAATVQRLQTEIESRGATIVATVDHAAAASANGLQLRPTTLVIFGNPKLGTPLMQSQQTAGLDLPLRVLVWQDAAGTVRIGYRNPSGFADLHGIGDRQEDIAKMTKALDTITSVAAQP